MLGDFEYKRIQSVEQGCQLLAEADGTGAILAGGTDLLVEIRNGLKSPSLLIDCKNVEKLDELSVSSSGTTIGSSVPLNRLIENRSFRAAHPALADALTSIGTYQLRNRATMVGNICNASPAADSAPVLLVLGALVEVRGIHGSRSIPIHDFFLGVKKTALRSDEIVTSIAIPPRPDTRTAFRKQQRVQGHDLAVVNVAGSYSPHERILRLAIGSCAPTPVLLDPIEVNSASNHTLIGRLIETVQSSISPISDVRATAAYRNAVLPVLVRRVLDDVLSGGGDS